MKLCLCWAVVALGSLVVACGVERSGIGGVDGSHPDAARQDAGRVCPEGTVDVNGDPEDGCECAVSSVPGERCNGSDDDCDGTIDEDVDGDPRLGGSCDGDDADLCLDGVVECVDGMPKCVDPQDPEHVEVCDDGALDEDCDGDRNEDCSCTPGSDPLRCGPETEEGICTFGMQNCDSGSWGACEGAVLPGDETCDNRDEDCDGRIDEGVVEACMNRCGTPGLRMCAGGSFGTCDAPAEPTEVCDGLDNDCDGNTDEALTPPANFCNAVGVCAGTAASCGGASGWECNYPAQFEDPEVTCDGLDNDCDGNTDEALTPPANFCNAVGVCAGTAASCGGASGWECNYPAQFEDPEVTCDGLDNDCDGNTDEAFDFNTDVNNCGGCGLVCSLPNAFAQCVARNCTLTDCAAGWVNADGLESNGCEYRCTSTGMEVCDGLDNDCDGSVDEGADCGTNCTLRADPSDPTHTYLLCQSTGDWFGAQAYCLGYGYHLAHIETSDEQSLLWGFASMAAGPSATWWIGLYFSARWQWTDGTAAYPSDSSAFDGWLVGQPESNSGCARLEEKDSQRGWKRAKCTNGSSYFICEAGD